MILMFYILFSLDGLRGPFIYTISDNCLSPLSNPIGELPLGLIYSNS